MPANPHHPPERNAALHVQKQITDVNTRLRRVESVLNGAAVGEVPVADISAISPGRVGRVFIDAASGRIARDTGSTWSLGLDPQDAPDQPNSSSAGGNHASGTTGIGGDATPVDDFNNLVDEFNNLVSDFNDLVDTVGEMISRLSQAGPFL